MHCVWLTAIIEMEGKKWTNTILSHLKCEFSSAINKMRASPKHVLDNVLCLAFSTIVTSLPLLACDHLL